MAVLKKTIEVRNIVENKKRSKKTNPSCKNRFDAMVKNEKQEENIGSYTEQSTLAQKSKKENLKRTEKEKCDETQITISNIDSQDLNCQKDEFLSSKKEQRSKRNRRNKKDLGISDSTQVRELSHKSDNRKEKRPRQIEGLAKKIELSEVDKMNHKELQNFVRLHNNRIELYCTNEYFNWISHLVGAVTFIVATGILGAECQYFRCSILQIASVIVYTICITFMQTASALHHGVGLGGVSWNVYYALRMMDYMSIYIAIWGSFLPVLSIVVDYPINLVMFIITTVIAIVGVVLKAVFNEKLKPVIGIGLYVVMGWNALAFSYFIFKNAGFVCFLLLILMGLSYTIGIIFFATERPIIIKKVLQGHELFHVFVLAGNLIHLFNVALCVIPKAGRARNLVEMDES